MNIVEFFIANERDDYFYNQTMQETLSSIKDLDYVIDVDDIAEFNMSWEKYHHNQTWCNFGYINEDNEKQLLYPAMRIDLECFLEALRSERNDIPYELYVVFRRKYFHIKYRRKEDEE